MSTGYRQNGSRAAALVLAALGSALLGCGSDGEAPASLGPAVTAASGGDATGAGSATGGMTEATTGGANASSLGGMTGSTGTQAGTPASTTGGVAAPMAAGMDAMATAGDDATAAADDPTMAGDDGTSDDSLEPVNVEFEGPYSWETFTEGAKAPEYAEGLIYYPTDREGLLPAMALEPGFTADNVDYEVFGRILASHGIVVMLVQPTTTGDFPDDRAIDLLAAVDMLRGPLNESGPLAGRIDTAHVGIMGHSMGGGGTLAAAAMAGDDIQAAVPLQPWYSGLTGSFSQISVPTLILGAEADAVAGVAQHAWPFYNAIPDTTTKLYLEVTDADHFYSTDRYQDPTAGYGHMWGDDEYYWHNAREVVAFLKLYLEEDERYATYLYGEEHDKVAGDFSRYETTGP